MILHNTQRSRRTAFTLMEMMVVVAIIVVLAGTGGFLLMNSLENAKVDTAKTKAKALGQAVQQFKLKTGRFPANPQELLSPVDTYLPVVDAEALMDPWGHEYQIQVDEESDQVLVTTTSSKGAQIVVVVK
jgi:general secretion pathway protein G